MGCHFLLVTTFLGGFDYSRSIGCLALSHAGVSSHSDNEVAGVVSVTTFFTELFLLAISTPNKVFPVAAETLVTTTAAASFIVAPVVASCDAGTGTATAAVASATASHAMPPLVLLVSSFPSPPLDLSASASRSLNTLASAEALGLAMRRLRSCRARRDAERADLKYLFVSKMDDV